MGPDMKRVNVLGWAVMAAAVVALAAIVYVWNRQQSELASDSQKLMEAADPSQRSALADGILKKYPWLPREQRAAFRMAKAAALGQAGRSGEMEKAYLEVIAESPDDHQALNNLAYEWARRGENLDSAEAFSARAVAIAKEKLPGRKPAGDSDEGWKETVRTVQGNYLDTYGWALYRRGRVGQALAALRQAAELAPDPVVDYHYGMALEKSGQADSALPLLARAAAAGTEDSAEVRAGLERIYLERNKSLRGLDKLVAEAREKLAAVRAQAMAVEAGKLVGTPAPAFTLDGLDGGKRSLADLKGKVAVLDFWASWCGPCLKSMPLLQKVHAAYLDRGAAVWGINLDEAAKLEAARRTAAGLGLEFPMVIGGKMGAGLDRAYQVTGIPTTFVIDKQGIIRYRHIGYRENLDDLVSKNIEELLKEP